MSVRRDERGTRPTRPPLSVVVPTFRRVESLARTLDALVAQNVPGIEIVVVDQNPPGLLDATLASYPVVYVHQEEPNASRARNCGFVRSSGQRVLFLDDDLVPTPGFCRDLLAVMDTYPEVRCLTPVLCGDVALTQPTNDPKLVGRHPKRADLGWVAVTMSAAMAFDREYFRASGGFDELLFRHARAGEDHELVRRMILRGQRVWLDRRLRIFHDEHVRGGAEMRTVPSAESFRRAVWSWALRERRHGRRAPNLDATGLFRLCRIAFLNRRRLLRPREAVLGLRLLREAIPGSREVLLRERAGGAGARVIDHLAAHEEHARRGGAAQDRAPEGAS